MYRDAKSRLEEPVDGKLRLIGTKDDEALDGGRVGVRRCARFRVAAQRLRQVVNISTTRTRLSSRGGAAYASMKGAIDVLSRHMTTELGPRRVTVNVVAPGAVATDFSGGIVRDNPE
jgi:NAD(P)-dependent dehydrogenase (short-subunit alcohol dehydrogenase family)